VSPFVTAYLVQHAFGGHAIPLSQGGIEVLRIVGIISDAEARDKKAPGLERAIPKNKGMEFASLLQQLAAELAAAPFGPHIKSLLLEIDADSKQRLPQRANKSKKAGDAKAGDAKAGDAKPGDAEAGDAEADGGKTDRKSKAKTPAPDDAETKAGDLTGKSAKSASSPKKKPAKKASSKPPTAKSPASKSPATKSPATKSSSSKSSSSKSASKAGAKPDGSKSKSATSRLTKRKPR
jgi:endonuclease-3